MLKTFIYLVHFNYVVLKAMRITQRLITELVKTSKNTRNTSKNIQKKQKKVSNESEIRV